MRNALIIALATAPMLAGAQTIDAGGAMGEYIKSLVEFVNGYIVPLIVAAAILVFIYGMFKYFIMGGTEEEQRSKGKQLMVWAVIGLVLMLSIQGIVNLLVAFFDLGGKTVDPVKLPF